jgi:hypothetical protein
VAPAGFCIAADQNSDFFTAGTGLVSVVDGFSSGCEKLAGGA